jgi:hypothetical protein
MSDFDAVLERLLADPSFPARLAADPAGALAGYDLDADEADLLRQQVSSDAGAQAAVVEDRVTKSSTFGLFSSFGIGGVAGGGSAREGFGAAGGASAQEGFGAAGGGMAREGFGSAPADGPAGPDGPGPAASGLGSAGLGSAGLGEWSEFGSAAGTAAQAAAGGLGSAPDAWGAGGADMSARSGLGSAPGLEDGPDLDGLSAVTAIGDAPRSGFGSAGEARIGLGEPEHLAPPKGYDNRVDADGDGSLDKATYRGREGGGAEIRVDLDGDGRADFVGVDKDLDNRVDFADYDKDHDGVFEKRMFDDDGDGFLDRTVLQ